MGTTMVLGECVLLHINFDKYMNWIHLHIVNGSLEPEHGLRSDGEIPIRFDAVIKSLRSLNFFSYYLY